MSEENISNNGISEEYVERMRQLARESRAFLFFTEDDVKRLNEILPHLKKHIPDIVSYVVEGIATNEGALKLLEEHPLPVETAIAVFEDWLQRVFSWNYGEDFGYKAFRIGNVHAISGVKPKFMSLNMGNFIIATNNILSKLIKDKKELPLYLSSVEKAFILNLTLMLESYETHRLENFLNITGMSRELYEKLSSLPW
jgi:hypothetical protein